jgi:hypothetical protein
MVYWTTSLGRTLHHTTPRSIYPVLVPPIVIMILMRDTIPHPHRRHHNNLVLRNDLIAENVLHRCPPIMVDPLPVTVVLLLRSISIIQKTPTIIIVDPLHLAQTRISIIIVDHRHHQAHVIIPNIPISSE